MCYRQKLWRNEIAVRKRLAMFARRNTKEDILFNLNTSSGMSGGCIGRGCKMCMMEELEFGIVIWIGVEKLTFPISVTQKA